MMKNSPEKYVSILGLADDVLMYCLERSYESYNKRDLQESFQVSPRETETSTSGILTLVTGLESFVKRLEYIVRSNPEYKKYIPIFDAQLCEKCKVPTFLPLREKIFRVVNEQLQNKYPGIALNQTILKRSLQDLSKVRNNITHNYLYEFSVEYDDDFELKNWSYTDIPKMKTSIKKDQTEFLGMNKIPNQIAFTDILKSMLVFDTVVKLMELSVEGINYRFAGYHKLGGRYAQNFYQVLTFFIEKMLIDGKKADLHELNKSVVKISKALRVKLPNPQSIEKELMTHLERSNLLRDTIINYVSSCSICGNESLMLNGYRIVKCLSCELKK